MMKKDENHIEKGLAGFLLPIPRFQNTFGKLVQDSKKGAMDMFYRYKKNIQYCR